MGLLLVYGGTSRARRVVSMCKNLRAKRALNYDVKSIFILVAYWRSPKFQDDQTKRGDIPYEDREHEPIMTARG